MKLKQYKISFCTVCMNRLHHLKQTLPINIENNILYDNIEFLVLDYNSSDGLEEWIKTEMKYWIDKGIVVYYKTPTPKYFDRSHSRNLMFRLSSGDIICNVDADNFTGAGFAEYINTHFNESENTFLIPDTQKEFYYLRDALGRFCSWKKDFIEIKGYDEEMSGYGFEDDDLYSRLKLLGRQEGIIMDLNFLKAITHDNAERVSNEFYASNIKDVFINYINYHSSEVIFLYLNMSFEMGEVEPNHLKTASPVLIRDYVWKRGSYRNENTEIIFSDTDNEEMMFILTAEGNLSKGEHVFYRVTELNFMQNIAYELSIIKNMGKFLLNKKQHLSMINSRDFGVGSVYKNFSETAVFI